MNGALAGNLAGFCERVGLHRRGRLSDDWDQEFGWRELRAREQGWVNLMLWRHEDDEWSVELTFETNPLPDEEAAQLRQEILDAAAAVNMTIVAESGLERPRSNTE